MREGKSTCLYRGMPLKMGMGSPLKGKDGWYFLAVPHSSSEQSACGNAHLSRLLLHTIHIHLPGSIVM